MYNFDFLRPATLSEALDALTGEEAMPLSGGQTLLPSLKSRLASPELLVSLSELAELRGIKVPRDGTVRIGAASTHAEVAARLADVYPALAGLAGGIGDPSVRNRGTIGGSLANNDPAACYPAGTLGSVATVHTDRRDVASDDYFEGMFSTALEHGEVITAVSYRVPQAAHYIKFRQLASGFALVGVFYARYPDHVRVAITGAGADGVFRWTEAEAAIAEGGVAALASVGLPDAPMMSDIHGDAEYRRAVAAELTRRCVIAAEADAGAPA